MKLQLSVITVCFMHLDKLVHVLFVKRASCFLCYVTVSLHLQELEKPMISANGIHTPQKVCRFALVCCGYTAQ